MFSYHLTNINTCHAYIDNIFDRNRIMSHWIIGLHYINQKSREHASLWNFQLYMRILIPINGEPSIYRASTHYTNFLCVFTTYQHGFFFCFFFLLVWEKNNHNRKNNVTPKKYKIFGGVFTAFLFLYPLLTKRAT